MRPSAVTVAASERTYARVAAPTFAPKNGQCPTADESHSWVAQHANTLSKSADLSVVSYGYAEQVFWYGCPGAFAVH